jgi:nucleoid-associated protein YgaU
MIYEGIMTRETKIGLLVGLAFIIVIGVLLSDHLSNTSADPQARLTESGPNVRSSFTIPAGTARPPTPVAAITNVPQNEVMTQQELSSAPDASGAISVSVGGSTSTVQPLTVMGNRPTQQPWQASDTDLVPVTSGPLAMASDAPIVTRLPVAGSTRVHANMGATTAAPTASPLLVQVQDDHEMQAISTANTKAKVLKEYKAEPGDSLSRMARRFYGANTKSHLDAILAANPQMKGDATKVVAGRTYIIPTVDGAKPAAAKTEASKVETNKAETDRTTASVDNSGSLAAPVAPVTQVVPARGSPAIPPPAGTSLSAILTPAPEATATKTEMTKAEKTESTKKTAAGRYTAKDGDTLWKIAAAQMGSGASWKDLKDLNKDVLKGSDTVRPGMVLKLPAAKSSNR